MLEKQRVLQDTYDTLQAEFQFELDQHTQQMELKSRECSEMQTKINVSIPSHSYVMCMFIIPVFQTVIKVLTVWYGFVGVAAYSSGRERAEQQREIPADRTQRECVQVSERDMQTSVKPAL